MDSSIEQVIIEAITTDQLQVVLSAGEGFLDVFDECLERVLQQQLQLDAQGVVRSWLRTQLMVAVRVPKSRKPLETLYQQIVKKAGPETFAAFYPDLLLKQHRDNNDTVVQALLFLSEAVQKRYSDLEKSLFAYLLKACSQDKLEEMGLSENLEHLDDKLFVLSMVLQCMIGVKAKIATGGTVGPACRVYLLLEIDNLLMLADEAAWAFLHALEILSQDAGEGFTIWMYTKNSADIEDVKKQIGTSLVQRWITHICKTEKIIE